MCAANVHLNRLIYSSRIYSQYFLRANELSTIGPKTLYCRLLPIYALTLYLFCFKQC